MIFNTRQTVILAILVLFLGKFLNKKISVFRDYNIPEAVSGGLFASVFVGIIHYLFNVQIDFSLYQRDVLLLIFFTTIGLTSRFSTLIEGGKTLVIFLFAAVVYLFIQNVTGIGVAYMTGIDQTIGLLGGSVALSGGHGTSIAWAPILKNSYAVENAMEIGIACATFGLVLGGLIGGPIAKFLVSRYKLKSQTDEEVTIGVKHDTSRLINVDAMLSVLLIISVAVGIGTYLHDFLAGLGFQLPVFVTCIFGGIVLTNIGPHILPKMQWPDGTPTLALVSELSLGLFLAMSLMSLQLWTLVDLAFPIIFILLAQVIVVTLFTIFVLFRLIGKNYDAAVMSAGYAGLALGATPTAIANMTAVTKKYGASPKSFIIVPLVGAFFIDIANAVIIKMMLIWVH
ncbi:MAG: sodium/glutamate symporter [Candidatus Omnitrophica bacterium]|nr:sodium/glutamate symporter [Candidatus Omnitrophota bacterium]